MHYSLKMKILDLDYIESIVEQDITSVQAEKILGGTLITSKPQQLVREKTLVETISVSKVQAVKVGVKVDINQSTVEPIQLIPIPIPLPSWHIGESKADLQLQITV
ncbi:hypothetical protein IQ229_17870 [Nostoc cf. edaphicum LEGE 07299]|uniref:Uncharacterized protein n=1 Tax=Nostoc cf. edaphicum LEGE 07299 TaxID=2777974 RepID=A0ABR9U3R0_9NOSO|nr:hypothetical protein [Nostoc edaphicum]MBE9106727.1 hypothetical protein [Nostoc cf. edaphicum LEGE 07299]